MATFLISPREKTNNVLNNIRAFIIIGILPFTLGACVNDSDKCGDMNLNKGTMYGDFCRPKPKVVERSTDKKDTATASPDMDAGLDASIPETTDDSDTMDASDVETTSCSKNTDCPDDQYCDLTQSPPICMSPPAQTTCKKHTDCPDGQYCDSSYSPPICISPPTARLILLPPSKYQKQFT